MTQHETNASAGLSPARALADGQILTCMPADDSKNEKNCLSSFSVGAQSQGNKTSNITITQSDAAPAPLQRLSVRAAKERQERNNNQNGYFFSS
jgi:hypothetical protein